MPCQVIETPTGPVIVCSRGGPKPCHYCGKPSTVLCDFLLNPPLAIGKKPLTRDRACCWAYSRAVRRGVDYCMEHDGRAIARAVRAATEWERGEVA